MTLCLRLSSQNLETLKSEKPFVVNGGASINGSYYSSNDSSIIIPKFGYAINVSPVFKVYGSNIPFHFTYANNKSNLSKPFFRLGMAPSYKWAKLYLGNNALNYNKYVFGGINTWGVGVELSPKKFVFSAFKGNLGGAIIPDTTILNSKRIVPRYNTDVVALKIGIKSSKYGFAVTYFSGKDDTTSIPAKSLTKKISAHRSKAVGTELRFSLSKYITFQLYKKSKCQ